MKLGYFASLLVFTAAAAHAGILYNSGFANDGYIPDGDLNGWQDTRTVSGFSAPLAEVSVSLNISGGYNGDIYAYLTHSSGGFVVLLNRVGRTTGSPGGYGDAGFNITLWDSAATDIHFYGGNGGALLTGTYQPDGRNISPTASTTAFSTATRDTSLAAFNGFNPNGEWTLFIADVSGGGGQSRLDSWELNLTPVPEPTTQALIAFGFIGAGVAFFRWLRRRP